MPEQFMKLPERDQADILNAAAHQLKKDPVVLEKESGCVGHCRLCLLCQVDFLWPSKAGFQSLRSKNSASS